MKLFTRIFCLLSLVAMSSCNLQKKIVYFQDASQNEIIKMAENYEVRIKPHDRLKILVSSKDYELASPFNSSVSYNALAPADKGYTSLASARGR